MSTFHTETLPLGPQNPGWPSAVQVKDGFHLDQTTGAQVPDSPAVMRVAITTIAGTIIWENPAGTKPYFEDTKP